MMHLHRVHRVQDVATAEDLAKKLTEQSWCLCQGFRLGALLFLNDSTSEDGAGEWAVFRLPEEGAPLEGGAASPVAIQPRMSLLQIESITFSWCTCGTALGLIELMAKGQLVVSLGRYDLRFDHPLRCPLCA